EMYASSPDGRLNNGQVNLYLSDGRDTGPVDAAKHPASIFSITGRSSGDLFGSSVAIGDVTGDGLGDLVAAASLSDGPGGAAALSMSFPAPEASARRWIFKHWTASLPMGSRSSTALNRPGGSVFGSMSATSTVTASPISWSGSTSSTRTPGSI